MTCESKDARTDHSPTVSACLFDGMNVTLTIIITFTPVQLNILFNHGRKCTRSCGTSTAC